MVAQGILDDDRPSAPVTLVNGVEDTVFPIDDTTIVTSYGSGALVRLFPGQGHMGEPASSPWVNRYWKTIQARGSYL